MPSYVCSKCNYRSTINDVICPYCGAEMVPDPAHINSNRPQSSQSPQSPQSSGKTSRTEMPPDPTSKKSKFWKRWFWGMGLASISIFIIGILLPQSENVQTIFGFLCFITVFPLLTSVIIYVIVKDKNNNVIKEGNNDSKSPQTSPNAQTPQTSQHSPKREKTDRKWIIWSIIFFLAAIGKHAPKIIELINKSKDLKRHEQIKKIDIERFRYNNERLKNLKIPQTQKNLPSSLYGPNGQFPVPPRLLLQRNSNGQFLPPTTYEEDLKKRRKEIEKILSTPPEDKKQKR